MPNLQLKQQLQLQWVGQSGLIKDWKAIPKAERILLIELAACTLISLNAPALGLLALMASLAHYGYVLKPSQDALVREYKEYLNRNINNMAFFNQNPRYQEIVKEVGGTPAALHNACILQMN